MLAEYKGLIEQIEDGYYWEFAEYRNDMWIRDAIQELLESETLGAYPEFGDFRAGVTALDTRLDAELSAERFPSKYPDVWWHWRFPRRAAGAFLRELEVLYDYKAIDASEEDDPSEA